MERRSSSPSAHFYAQHGASSLAQVDQRHQPVPEMHHQRRHNMQPFEHFQGFSSTAPADCHEEPRQGIYSLHIPEEMISPRMPIPNPATYDSPQLLGREMMNDNDGGAFDMYHYVFNQHGCDVVGASGHIQTATRPQPSHDHAHAPEAHQSPPLYATPTSDYPIHTAASSLLPSMMARREANHPPQELAAMPSITIRVPSYSPISSLTSLLGGSYSLNPAAIAGHHTDRPTPSDSEPGDNGGGGGGPTIYPEDSRSTAGAPPAGGTAFARMRETLADDIVGVHDICLAASQRYLEALRANWDLRNGEVVQPAGGGDRRPARARARARWSPYDRHGPRRRARSETDAAGSGDSAAFLDDDDNNDDDVHHHHHHQKKRDNPIPMPTTSLLHNIHHICGLIWARAQRDRDDVLGAEAAACRAMARLHERSERVVLHRAADLEVDPEGCWRRVVESGRAVCRVLGDGEGLERLGGGGGGEEDEDGNEEIWGWC